MFRIKPANLIIGLFATLFSCKSSSELSSSGSSNEIVLTIQQEQRFDQLFFEALREKAVDNDEAALENFLGALSINPQSDAVLYEVSLLYKKQGKFIEALAYLDKAIIYHPTNTWILETKAEILGSLKRHSDEAKVYGQLFELNPGNIEWLYRKAIAQITASELDDAINSLNQIETQIGLQEDISRQKQEIYLKQNNFEAAVKEIQALIDDKPNSPRAYGLMAELFAANGKLEEARALLEKMLQLDPSNAQAMVGLADMYQREGRPEEATNLLLRAFRNEKLDVSIKIQIIGNYFQQALRDQVYLKQTERLLEVLLEEHGEVARVHSVQGDFFYRQNKNEEAMASFQKALELGETDMNLYMQIFDLQLRLGEFEALGKTVEEGLELYPNQSEFYLYKGIAEIQQENYTQAIIDLQNGLNYTNPPARLKADFYQYIGDAQHNLKNYKKSDENYDASLKINPNNAYLLNNYAYYLSLRDEKLEKAEEMSKQSLNLMPNTASFLDTYAWIMYKRGKYDIALENMFKAIAAADESSGEMLEHLGDILFKLGRTDEALKEWQKAVGKPGVSDKLEDKIRDQKLYE